MTDDIDDDQLDVWEALAISRATGAAPFLELRRALVLVIGLVRRFRLEVTQLEQQLEQARYDLLESEEQT